MTGLQTALNAKAGLLFADTYYFTVNAVLSTNPALYTDLSNSGKTINLPAGTAVITWSTSCYSAAGAGFYRFRPIIGTLAPDVGNALYTNEQLSHKQVSGSWVVSIPKAGLYSVRLQAFKEAGGALDQDGADYMNWSIIVFN